MIAFLLGAPVSLFFIIRGEVLPAGLQSNLHLSALPSPPLLLWPTIVLTLFVGIVLEGAYRLVKEKEDELEAVQGRQPKAQPNLEIVIDTEPTFRQEQRVKSSEGFPTKQTVCRVGIRHDGHATVDNVSVELESMKPHSLSVPLRLHQMNDNPLTGGQFKQDFSLDGGQTQYIDVVVEEHDDNEQPTRSRLLLLRRARGVHSKLLISHIVPGVPGDIPVKRHKIVIFAHGHDAEPVRRNFIIDVDDNGELQFASA